MPSVGPRATGTGDAWALCSIVWEKPALLGHELVMTPKGHTLSVPPMLSHTIPLLYLAPRATEHSIIHMPSLSRTSQRSANSRIPELQVLGFEHPAVDSCAAALCIQQCSPHCMLPWDVHFHSRGADILNLAPSGLQAFNS